MKDKEPASGPTASDPSQVMWYQNKEYLNILLRQLPFVLVFTVSSTLTALALTYIASEKYEAEVAIFYRPVEVMRLRTQQATALGSPAPSAAFTVIGKTIEELLRSRTVLENVVHKLELDVERPEDLSGEPWYIRYYETSKDYLLDQVDIIWAYLKFGRVIEGDKTEGAIMELASNISIAIDDSYVSSIKVRDKNNIRAAAIVDELANELITWLKEKEREPLTFKRESLEEVLAAKQAEIDYDRGLLRTLLMENSISSIAHELEQGNIRISSLETSQIDVLVDITNFETQTQAMEEKLEQQDDPNLQGRGRIQADDYKRLTSDSLTMSIGLAGAREKYKALEKEISDLKNRLLTLSELEIEYKRIDGNLGTSMRDHLLVHDALQEVIVREYSIDSEIGVLYKAAVPLEPVTPIKVYHVSLAMVLGIVVSVGLVYLLSFFGIRLLFASAGIAGRRSKPVAKEGTLPEDTPPEGEKAES